MSLAISPRMISRKRDIEWHARSECPPSNWETPAVWALPGPGRPWDVTSNYTMVNGVYNLITGFLVHAIQTPMNTSSMNTIALSTINHRIQPLLGTPLCGVLHCVRGKIPHSAIENTGALLKAVLYIYIFIYVCM